MSWDIIVMDLPEGMKSIDEIPKNFVPRPLGRRSDIMAKIVAIFPDTDFSDPSWGVLQLPGCWIEFNMGSDEEVHSFAMHVRGSDSVRRTWRARPGPVVGVRAVRAGSKASRQIF